MTATSEHNPRAIQTEYSSADTSSASLAVLRRMLKPSLFDCILVLLALMFVTLASYPLLNSDGDMPRHLRVGEMILAERALPWTDTLSHTKYGEEFLAFEWGSEILFALGYAIAGLPGVMAVSGLVVGLTFGLVILLLERSRVHPMLLILTLTGSILVGLIHWLPRPHLFSALGAIVVLLLLERREHVRPWMMLPVFMIWANVHGAFMWGLTLIGLYAAGSLIEWKLAGNDPDWLQLGIDRMQMFFFALLGSLINPFGVSLHTHIIGYLNEDFILSVTGDFVSPNFQALGPQLFLGSLLVIMAGIAIARYRPSIPHLLVILATTAFSLHAVRNIPLFAVTAIPIFAIYIDPAFRGLLLRLGGRDQSFDPDRRVAPGFFGLVGVVGVFLFAAYGGGSAVVTDEFSNERFPVDAVAYARANDLQGNMFNEFLWGGYILYAWPEQRVYIDAQTAFYGEELTREYGRLITLSSGWRETLDARSIDFVLLPAYWPLSLELEREPGWDVWFRDETAVILVRTGHR